MRRKISLYIADRLVDLDDESFILFNYTMEDMSNPTVVRNSFSQQVTLKGTPNNNQIFGDIWRSDRVTLYGQSGAGVDFDAAKKTPFTIYNEMNEILESGYCKLDRVTRNKNTVEYSVTLFGGLGSFFFALSYDADGNKRTLADLKFTGSDAGDDELSFTINKEAVAEAWRRLRTPGGSGSLWDILNFCPAYNGLPSGLFDADKALFDADLAGVTIPSGYSSPGGNLVLASLPKQYTEWETKDLRSYLQRPVIKMSKIIEAICQDYNNGGYEVELDPDFFNADNPYYADTWLTLPIINTLDVQIVEGDGSIIPQVGTNTIPGGGVPATNYVVNLAFRPRLVIVGGSGSAYYLHCEDEYISSDVPLTGYYLTYLTYTATAYDADNNAIQQRIVRAATRQSPGLDIPHIDAIGYFDSLGRWIGDSVQLNFDANGISYITVQVAVTAGSWGNTRYAPDANLAWTDPSSYTPNFVVSSYDQLYNADENKYHYTTSESARSGATITKRMLLSSDRTPADYLLSFCKQFGLVFLYDKGERKVSILQKKSFYLDNVIDLTDRVDVSQPISTVPFAFDSKWYDFALPYENGDFAKYYANIYDRVFGMQKVNTGYEFNAEEKNLLEGIVFKGACEVLENSKYFADIVDGVKLVPAIFQDSGGTFTLQNRSGETEEFPIPLPSATSVKTWWNSTDKTFDFLSKLQFHNADNAAYEERDTLVFFNGMMTISGITRRIGLSDDTATMMAMNDNTPCWILDPARVGGYAPMPDLPVFSRYAKTGNVVDSSLDFGTPAEVAIPDLTFAAGSSIFEKFWEAYIGDRYDDDSRVMTCKVNLSGFQINESLLRNFFYYDGSIWALNKIINHSLTTYDDTECEFVKVQDTDNYLN